MLRKILGITALFISFVFMAVPAFAGSAEKVITDRLIQRVLEENKVDVSGKVSVGGMTVVVVPMETREYPTVEGYILPCRSFVVSTTNKTHRRYRPRQSGGIACRDQHGYWQKSFRWPHSERAIERAYYGRGGYRPHGYRGHYRSGRESECRYRMYQRKSSRGLDMGAVAQVFTSRSGYGRRFAIERAARSAFPTTRRSETVSCSGPTYSASPRPVYRNNNPLYDIF